MVVKVRCPNPQCAQSYEVPDAELGHTAVCKKCAQQFTLSAASRETAGAAGARGTAGKPAPIVLGQAPKKLGRFEIRARLGAGRFGSVYRAHDPILGREVALKVPHPAVLLSKAHKDRVLVEAKAAAQLRHPNIVPVHEAGADGETYYVASAFIEGRTLEEAIEQEQFDFRRAVKIVMDLAEALEYAHSLGIVHRDVKPANVMLDGKGAPLLMDFGLARLAESESKLTRDGAILGTPAYMSPEQAAGRHDEVGPGSDQYSLGVILYELLCGKTPFSGPPPLVISNVIHQEPPSPRTISPQIPRDLETICQKAMRKQPMERYADCKQMAEDLRRWLYDEPIRARRMGMLERAMKWAKRNPALAALAVAVLVLAIVSSFSALGILLSRQQLARALESEKEQTGIAQAQTEIAQAQTKRAEEQTSLAEEKERLAQQALTKLKQETEGRSKAEAERAAEMEKRVQGAEELKKRESQLQQTSTALDQAKKDAESAASDRAKAVESSTWFQYVEHLLAADKACLAKDFATAKKELQACPEEHRSFEWACIDSAARGQVPSAASMGVDWPDSVPVPGSTFAVNREISWCCTRARNSAVVVVHTLPDFSERRTVYVGTVGTKAANTFCIDPDGRTLLETTPNGSRTYVYDTETGKRITSLVGIGPLVPAPFSSDGLWFLATMGGQPRLIRTDKWQVLTTIDTPSIRHDDAIDFQGKRLSVVTETPSDQPGRDADSRVGSAAPPTSIEVTSFSWDPVAKTRTTWVIPWVIPVGSKVNRFRSGIYLYGKRLVMSPDSRWAAFGSQPPGGALRYVVLDLSAKRVVSEPQSVAFVLSFSPDGKRMLVITPTGQAQLSCVPNGQAVPVLNSAPPPLRGVSFGGDSLRLRWQQGRLARPYPVFNPGWTRMFWATSEGIHCWSIDERDVKKRP